MLLCERMLYQHRVCLGIRNRSVQRSYLLYILYLYISKMNAQRIPCLTLYLLAFVCNFKWFLMQCKINLHTIILGFLNIWYDTRNLISTYQTKNYSKCNWFCIWFVLLASVYVLFTNAYMKPLQDSYMV